MRNATVEGFTRGRREWLRGLSESLMSCRTDVDSCFILDGGPDLNVVEKAFLMIHVGASHIYGIDDRDIALEGT